MLVGARAIREPDERRAPYDSTAIEDNARHASGVPRIRYRTPPPLSRNAECCTAPARRSQAPRYRQAKYSKGDGSSTARRHASARLLPRPGCRRARRQKNVTGEALTIIFANHDGRSLVIWASAAVLGAKAPIIEQQRVVLRGSIVRGRRNGGSAAAAPDGNIDAERRNRYGDLSLDLPRSAVLSRRIDDNVSASAATVSMRRR